MAHRLQGLNQFLIREMNEMGNSYGKNQKNIIEEKKINKELCLWLNAMGSFLYQIFCVKTLNSFQETFQLSVWVHVSEFRCEGRGKAG